MVSFTRLLFRIVHVVSGMLLFAVNIVPIVKDSKHPVRDFTAFGGTIRVDLAMSAIALTVLVVLAGLLNAMLLKPAMKMRNQQKALRSWRVNIYVFKMLLVVACSPVLDRVILPRLLAALLPGKPSEGELQQVAAFVRAKLLIFAACVGAYARFSREDAETASAKIDVEMQTAKK